MSIIQRAESGRNGLGFANALRDFLVSGIVFIDDEQKVAALTSEARQILASDSPPPLSALQPLPPALAEMAREAAASGAPTNNRELEFHVHNRGMIRVRACAVPLKWSADSSGVALVLSDLTAANHLDEQVQELDRLANAGTLAASMAHEIKNALVAGKTFMDLLLEQNQQSELVDVVRRELGRIDAIVGRMLKLAGPARKSFAPVQVHEVIEHSIKLMEPHLENKAISIERLFKAPVDRVNGDEYQLQQAFVNLLLNAYEAMGVEGSVKVITEQVSPRTSASLEPPQIRVTIKDSGTGILPEHLDHLFEPFFTTKSSGTGLGLAVTKRIFQEHRGDITVESKPGEGASFHILLPLL